VVIPIWGTRHRLGIAIATRAYKAYRELLLSDRWKKLERAGARPQAAEGTIDTIPEKTLLAFADHGKVSAPLLAETSYAEDIIAKLRHEGLDDDALASRHQRKGVGDFAKSWRALLARIGEKSDPVASAVSG
jgi:transaldolase